MSDLRVPPKAKPPIEKPIVEKVPAKFLARVDIEVAAKAIADCRALQVANAHYTISGSEILGFVDGSLVAKAFMAVEVEKQEGESQTAYLHRKTERNKGLLNEVLQRYAKFSTANIFSFRKDGDFLFVVSRDGRKYKVNLKTEAVEA